MNATPRARAGGAAAAPHRPLRRAVSTLWLVGVVALAVLVWPSSLGGCTTLTIVSGLSMEPTYSTGDLVVARCGEPAVGDVVVYAPPGIDGTRVIHRVVGGDADGWVAQGDNNDFLDPWTPSSERVLGIARWHVPGIGTIGGMLLNPLTWASLLLIAAALVVWPSRERGADGPASAEDAPESVRTAEAPSS